ncbi:MAG: glycosyltransferase family 39 protein [Calditrichaeota bacterium]|nr:glycosyltransferase family 39 protein [Calditrichota bacterium]
MASKVTPSISKNEQRAVSLILIGAFLLRVYTLGSESFWLDEAITWHRLKDGPLSFLFDWDADTQGPVYGLILWPWMKLFGTGEAVMRFPSVIFGVLGLHAMYLLGRRIFNHRAALWAIAFAAVNPFLIYYAQETRPYSLWFWTSLMAIWYLLRLIDNHSKVNSVGTITFTLLSLYTHPYGPFLLALQVSMIAVLAPRAEWKRFLKPALIAGIAYLPEILVFAYTFVIKIRDKHNVGAWITQPDLFTPWLYMRFYFAWDKLAAGCSLASIGGLIFYRKKIADYRTGFITLAAIAFGFFVLPWLVSQVSPILWPRYTITVVAALLLLLGWIMSETKRPLQILAVGLFFLGSALPLYHYYTEYDKDPWRQAVAWFSPQIKSGETIVIHPPRAPMALEYYMRDLNSHPVVVVDSTTDVHIAIPDTGSCWFVTAKYNDTDRQRGAFYEYLKETCDCDSTYNSLPLFPRNPFRIFRAEIEITHCRARASQHSQY